MQAPQTPASSVTGSKSSKGKAPSVPNTTPSSRLDMPDSLSDRDRARVQKIDPNSGRCVVENCDEARAVDFAHVVARRFATDEILGTVEWHWNMRSRGLNLDTRWNIFRAGVAIHRLFDSCCWIFVPEAHIVQQYHDSLTFDGTKRVADRYNFPEIPIPEKYDFYYQFVPIGINMSKIALFRQDNDKSDMTPEDFTIHIFPYNTLPYLKSHIHPKFAILEAGFAIYRVIQEAGPSHYTRLIQKFPILTQISEIYEAWMAGVPEDAENDSTYFPPDDGSDDNPENDKDSNYTEKRPRPGKSSKGQKRPRQNDPQTPTPAAKSQRGKQTQGRQRALKREPSLCLSKKSLEVHDHASGEGDWTNETIQIWSERCRPLRDADHTPWMQFQAEICV